jgi:hypothetical protein
MRSLPFLYGVIFALALCLTFTGSMLTVFVIPREATDEGTETIDLSAFTKPDIPTEEPTYVLTLPPVGGAPEPPSGDSPETDALTEPPVVYPIITENSYLDEQISIVISTIREFGSNFHVAEVKLKDPFLLKTALAHDAYGLNITERTSDQARRVGAIFAVTVALPQADGGQIIDGCLVVRLAFGLCCEYSRNHADDHQHSEHQRKNLFHLFLISL